MREGVVERLDRKRDAFLLDIHLRDGRLDLIALAEFLDGLLAAPIPGNVGEVHHPVDVVVEADKETEFRDVLDLSLDMRADRMSFGKHLPGIPLGLLETQGHAPLRAVDLEHHDVNFLRGRNDLARMDVLLGPAHFRNVDQALDSRLQLDERAVVRDVGHAAMMYRVKRIVALHRIPRIFLELLHSERDPLGFLVDLDDLHFHGVVYLDDIGRMADPSPRHVRDMEQAVNAAEIDERSVFGDVLDHAVNCVAFLDSLDDRPALTLALLFQDRAARDDDVAATPIHFQDLEGLLHPHDFRGIAHRSHIDLAAGQERYGAVKVNGKPALDPAEYSALDFALVGISIF